MDLVPPYQAVVSPVTGQTLSVGRVGQGITNYNSRLEYCASNDAKNEYVEDTSVERRNTWTTDASGDQITEPGGYISATDSICNSLQGTPQLAAAQRDYDAAASAAAAAEAAARAQAQRDLSTLVYSAHARLAGFDVSRDCWPLGTPNYSNPGGLNPVDTSEYTTTKPCCPGTTDTTTVLSVSTGGTNEYGDPEYVDESFKFCTASTPPAVAPPPPAVAPPTSCPVGQTLSGNACVPCPSGTYKNNTGTGACTPCTNSAYGKYVSATCTSTADTQFASWPNCELGQSLVGYGLGSSTSLGNPGYCENNNLANGQQCSSDVDCASGYCDTGGDKYYCRTRPPPPRPSNLPLLRMCSTDQECESGYCDTGYDDYPKCGEAPWWRPPPPPPPPAVAPPPPINCEVSDWTSIGNCTATVCGTSGEQRQTRTVTRNAANNGAACPALEQYVSCNAPACPTSCPVGRYVM